MGTKEVKKSTYWIVPSIAGLFFTLGYGSTHRLWVLFSSWEQSSSQEFKNLKTISQNASPQPIQEIKKPIQTQGISSKVKIDAKLMGSNINSKNLWEKEEIFSQENFKKVFQALSNS